MRDPTQVVEQNFIDTVHRNELPPSKTAFDLARSGLSAAQLVEVFESQVLSRQLDLSSRRLQAAGQGFYTIGSSGHEGTAAVAAAFRVNDMAFLHYRDAGFFIQRSKMLAGETPIWDMLLSFVASSDDPISGGRHKVLGSKRLFIPPQTSTIASHLPKSVGTAHSISLARGSGVATTLAEDAVIVCSFGDASVNHSTAQGAFNTASWIAYQNIPLPIVFVCEDNGLGISMKTPQGWVAQNMGQRPALHYLHCNGLDALDTYATASTAEHYARRHKKPVFLHMKCVRLFGHAGSDTQDAYLKRSEIDDQQANDPLLYTAALLVETSTLKCDEILDIYHQLGERVARVADEVVKRPKLSTVREIKQSLIPPRLEITPAITPSAQQRELVLGRDLAAQKTPRHMARLINWALADLMIAYPSIVLVGEDVGPKGGVYGVSARLHERFGPGRVVDSLLDEQSILGLAIGLGHNGQLAIPEDAVLLLRECVRLAREEQRVVVFLEPIALYMTRDLYETDDGQWCGQYPPPNSSKRIALGEPGVHGNGRELAILTYGNGHYLSRRAAKTLKENHSVRLRVVDLRWLAPLDEARIIKSIKGCRHVLIVDECRRTGSQSEALRTLLAERASWQPAVSRITAEDSFIPLGIAATVPLPSEDSIIRAALELLGKSQR
jgi:2-oxoisovalerate dehydrogenase E1 component